MIQPYFNGTFIGCVLTLMDMVEVKIDRKKMIFDSDELGESYFN